MRIAVISDIHGNLIALETVLDDLANDHVDILMCLGDVALRGPRPRQCLRRVQELGCPVILGNTDSWLAELEPAWLTPDDHNPMMTIDLWCADQLSAVDRQFIQSFEPTIELRLGSSDSVCFFHASPRDNAENIFSTTPEDELAEMISGSATTVLVGGHTHLQMLRRKYEKTIVNVGSVGRPFLRDHLDTRNSLVAAPWAEYAVIGSANGRLSVDFRRVALDLDKLEHDTIESGMPHAEWWLSEINRHPAALSS